MKKSQYDRIAKKYSRLVPPLKKYCVKPTLLKMCPNLKGKDVLDLACGSGYFTRLIKKNGAKKVVGIDKSKEQIKLAKKIENKTNLGIKYIKRNVIEHSLGKLGNFDLITTTFLLHYSENKTKLFKMCKNAYSALKKKGKFVNILSNPEKPFYDGKKYGVTSTGEKNPKEGNVRKVTFYKNGKPILSFNTYYWKKDTYEKALKKAGFKNIEWVKATVSSKGKEKYKQGFWDKLLEGQFISGLKCEK